MKKSFFIKTILLLCAVLLPAFALSAYAEEADTTAAEQAEAYDLSYVDLLFDTSYVHTMDIRLTDGTWDDFISTCTDKAYWDCDLTIDGEEYPNAVIRAKGNSSMQMVKNGKYSFKIEFDHYSDNTYHGLDKLNLNNMTSDDSSMRDYLVYRMMDEFGVDAPLCSYIYVTVNGEDWGLYLALEGVEDAFLRRNYGADFGDLYKPDSISNHKGDDDEEDTASGDMGGGPQFGGGQMPGAGSGEASADTASAEASRETAASGESGSSASSGEASSGEASSETHAMPGGGGMPGGGDNGGGPGGGGGGGGSGQGTDDVKLQYIDDDPESYPYIFDSAKTDVSRGDKYRLIGALKRLGEQTDLEDTLDIDEVLRYFVSHIFVCNNDSYTGSMIHNYYLYEKDGRLSMIPWDYNQAFGDMDSTSSDSVNEPIDTPTTADMDQLPMIAWIFDDPAYTEQYHATFLEFIDRFCSSGWIEDTIRETEELIAPYIARDPNGFCTEDEFHDAVEELSVFCRLRAESVLGQLNGSVPATDEAQTAEPEKLIDTSELPDSSGGSGDHGGGPGNGGGGFPGGGASGGPSGG